MITKISKVRYTVELVTLIVMVGLTVFSAAKAISFAKVQDDHTKSIASISKDVNDIKKNQKTEIDAIYEIKDLIKKRENPCDTKK